VQTSQVFELAFKTLAPPEAGQNDAATSERSHVTNVAAHRSRN
jgi:hypothetical protein